METPAQRWGRLVTALEDLVMEESAAVRTGDFAAANAIADRAAPVVEWLAAHPGVITPAMRERLALVQSERRANAEALEGEIARAREGLRLIATSRRRVAQIAPVYGRTAAPAPARLSAVG